MTDTEKKALDFIASWGGTDGGHHKQWVLDNLVKILTDDTFTYDQWIKEYEGEIVNGDPEYDWDEGIAP